MIADSVRCRSIIAVDCRCKSAVTSASQRSCQKKKKKNHSNIIGRNYFHSSDSIGPTGILRCPTSTRKCLIKMHMPNTYPMYVVCLLVCLTSNMYVQSSKGLRNVLLR